MTEEQPRKQPGISVFYQDEDGDIFHTYSSYARGGDLLIGTYNYLDLTPLGRRKRRAKVWIGCGATIDTTIEKAIRG